MTTEHPPDLATAVRELLNELRANRGPPEVPLLLTAEQAGDLLGIGSSTFRRKVASGSLPRPVTVDGLTRWRRIDLEKAVAQMRPARRRIAAEM